MPVLTLYSRAHCHLCAEARRMLDAIAPRFGLTVREVDVDGDPALAERYGEQIPVVLAGDREILVWPFTRVAALRVLSDLTPGRRPTPRPPPSQGRGA